ncbi:hypothetical protein EDD18DRAFT_1465368 [Armillaria luteobubalina]|uniref:Uncharacterized protein n=1 Tax=Armillaria luteobubalina TaxID=153913 RepID=A0AA39PXS9_9AGAR|nr:hypothetical protein EDD18DRAFT_1465368 [Armillaria luteobubalina]
MGKRRLEGTYKLQTWGKASCLPYIWLQVCNRRLSKINPASSKGARLRSSQKGKSEQESESDRAGPISTRKPRQRQPLGIKCEEELPISALPFSFINVTAPAYTPPVYDQPRVQRPMTAAYQFPASWTPQAQVPLPVQGLGAHHHHTYAPTAYTCDAMYPSSHYHYSVVPRVFAEQPYAVADQVLGGWPCPQAASYVDYGYAGTGLGVGGGAQWAQAFPKYGAGMDTSSESPVDDLIDSMARCDMSYY